VSIIPTIPYSAQYNMMNREGHECPPPIFGAPTLVWHLGISPHETRRGAKREAPLNEIHEESAREYEAARMDFFQAINTLLARLQERARFPRNRVDIFRPDRIPKPWAPNTSALGKPFRITDPENIRFTLWWADDATWASSEPSADALRVKVHATAYRDYITLSFYIDAGKPWNQQTRIRGEAVSGKRRGKIFEQIQSIYDVCEPRLVETSGIRPIVEKDLLPEQDISRADAALLMSASRFLYSEIWDDLWESLRIPSLEDTFGDSARVFANFRGLVLSTWGTGKPDELPSIPGSAGDAAFPRFSGRGGLDPETGYSAKEPNEANAVVKAFWPFIRRITPNADQREYIACGLMNWRALYISALSSARAYEWEEEVRNSETEIDAGNLPEELIQRTVGPSGEEVRLYDSQSEKSGEGPIRYLVLSKGEPHRRQIGRILDRINAMGAMRLIALRDWTIIRDASTQIQLRGLELDTMMRRWSRKRSDIRTDFAKQRQGKSASELLGLKDSEQRALQEASDEVEKDLIDLSAALDDIGTEARNGLHFRVNRSRFYVNEFRSLVASLQIGNIDTWVAYDQFVTRGLKPAFDFIDGVGDRLLGLRTRLQTVLEGIETSSLVTQISATRENTAELRNIAQSFARANTWLRVISALLATITLISALLGWRGVLGPAFLRLFDL